MKFKWLYLIFLIVLISACTRFHPIPSETVSIAGTFKANYRGKVFDGFFSLADDNLRLDIINSLGFSMYGLYVQGNNVLLKNYQTGEIYKNLKIKNINLIEYKQQIIYLAKNFKRLCYENNDNIFVLKCSKINSFSLPSDFIVKGNHKRLRVILSKIKILKEVKK